MAQGFTRPAGSLIIGATSVSGGTSGRILYETSGPVITDSANLQFDGTDFLIGSGIRARMVGQNRFRHLNTLASIKRTTTQSINDSTVTAVNFDAEFTDTDSLHDTVTNNSRITIALTGKYLVYASIDYAANSTGSRQCRIHKNGSELITNVGPAQVSPNSTILAVAILDSAAASDYYELNAYQTSGGALNVNANAGAGNPPLTILMVFYVGE